MAMPCKACAHADRAELDALLRLGSVPIKELAEKWRLSEAGARRHKARHLARLGLVPASDEVSVGYVLTAIVSALRDAEAVRAKAVDADRGDLVLRATREVRAASALILDRLGIDDSEIVDLFNLQEQFAQSGFAVIRRSPKVGLAIADDLASRGHRAIADEVREFATTALAAIATERASA